MNSYVPDIFSSEAKQAQNLFTAFRSKRRQLTREHCCSLRAVYVSSAFCRSAQKQKQIGSFCKDPGTMCSTAMITSEGSTVFPLETRSFEKKQIFQEEQKTICAIIKLVVCNFFKFIPSF